MQLGGIKPITPQDWQMPNPERIGSTAETRDESAAQLQQIKWLLVALLIIMIMKK